MAAQTGGVDNWQARCDLAQSNFHMLTNEISCDVLLWVGQEKTVFRAHQYVLISRSCVFNAMICGNLRQQDDGPIKIPDIEADIFEEFLKFMYTNDADITSDNVTGLLYSSKKYAVQLLEDKCLKYLEDSLTSENVCAILEQAHIYDEEGLYEKALKAAKCSGNRTLKSAGFTELCKECFNKIILADDLSAAEESVFSAAISWAKEECRRQVRLITPDSIRNILGQALYHIRFPLMEPRFFVQNVRPEKLLTDQESLELFEYYICPEKGIQTFIVKRRKSQIIVSKDKLIRVQRFSGTDFPWSWTCSGGGDDSIRFSVSHDVILVGFMLYGPFTQQAEENRVEYSVQARIFDQRDCPMAQSQVDTVMEVSYHDKYNVVMFQERVDIHRNQIYTLVVNIKGRNTLKGIGGMKRAERGGVVWTFMDSDKSTRGTNSSKGQIPGLVYCMPTAETEDDV
ncbi:BTB/POZ domain-containing protein 6-like [Haliotis cracherodii]|uniref:BTB/POZ domain-containing protein 6-like n=1 Tax=Haliotis cracherodii TaxID=6455 RepID=UPI0039EC69B6